MTPDDREKSLRAIAHLATEIRKATGATPWNYHGILGALHRGIPTEKTIAEIARAALWFAQHRTKQDTPLMLSEDGAHWHLDDDRAPLPPKPQALSEPKPPPLPPETIRTYRDRIRKETP